jgi:hypothetical protein
MTTPSDPPELNETDQASKGPRQEAWAAPVSRLKVSQVPPGATNINVEGRRTAGALQGFGQLWQKTYRVRLTGVDRTPEQVMRVWKENFPKYQPQENRFYPPMTGIQPGEVLFIEGRVPAFPGSPSIMPMASGVMVLYADETMFTVMTPEGFPESGWNTFSVYEEDDVLVAQIQSMCRATDPLYEFYFRILGSSQQQEQTWMHVLTSLAADFGVKGQPSIAKTCVDEKMQWAFARNIWQNAAVRTVFYKLGAPLRWARQAVKPKER